MYAQVGQPPLAILPGSPPGGLGAACTATTYGYLTSAGAIATCQSSVWTLIAGSAPAGTGIVPVNSGAYGTPGPLTGDATTSGASLAVTVVGLNGTNLAGLGSGFMQNATGTGVPSVVVDPLPFAHGGTAASSSSAARFSIGTGYLAYSSGAQNTQNLTGTTVDVTGTNYTVPANSMGNGGLIQAQFSVTTAGTTSKNLRINFGSCNFSMFTSATATTFFFTPAIFQNNPGVANAQQFLGPIGTTSSVFTTTQGTCSIDTTASMVVKLTLVCASCTTGDTVKLNQWSVVVMPVAQ